MKRYNLEITTITESSNGKWIKIDAIKEAIEEWQEDLHSDDVWEKILVGCFKSNSNTISENIINLGDLILRDLLEQLND